MDASFHLTAQKLYALTVVLEISFVSIIVWGKLFCVSGSSEYKRRRQGRLNFCLCRPNVLHVAQNGTNNHTEQLRNCCEPSAITPFANILPSTCSLREFIGRKWVGAVLCKTQPVLSDESRHGTKTRGPRRHITRGLMGPRFGLDNLKGKKSVVSSQNRNTLPRSSRSHLIHYTNS